MGDPKPASADALEREFASAITRAYAAMATALVVGVILAIIMSQQMWEHEGRLRVLGREGRKYRRQEALHSQRLRNSPVREEWFVGRGNTLPEHVASEPTARKERLEEIDRMLARLDSAIEAARSREKNPPKPGGNKIVVLPTADSMTLQFQRDQLAQYRTTYAAASALQTRIDAHAAEGRQLRESKQSLPTPFGQFNVSPRFGLMGVAFGVIGAYFYFIAVAAKARRIAIVYRGLDPDMAITRGLPAPDWLATLRGKDLSKTLGWHGNHPSRRLRSVAIHVVWIGLVAYFVYEIVQWRAWEDVLVAPNILLLSLTGIALLASIAATTAFLTDSTDDVYRSLPFNGPRRHFLAAAGTATGAGLALLYLWRRGWPKPKRPSSARVTFDQIRAAGVQTESLVVNAKTRVVHHVSVCGDHVLYPDKPATILGTDTLHPQRQIAILTAIARQDPQPYKALMLALSVAPSCIHLYDLVLAKAAVGRVGYAEACATLAQGRQWASDALARATAREKAAVSHKSKRKVVRAAKAEVQRFELLAGQLADREWKLYLNKPSKRHNKRRHRRKPTATTPLRAGHVFGRLRRLGSPPVA